MGTTQRQRRRSRRRRRRRRRSRSRRKWRVTWKESSNVVHSLLHRTDKTAVAAMEKIRLTRIPI